MVSMTLWSASKVKNYSASNPSWQIMTISRRLLKLVTKSFTSTMSKLRLFSTPSNHQSATTSTYLLFITSTLDLKASNTSNFFSIQLLRTQSVYCIKVSWRTKIWPRATGQSTCPFIDKALDIYVLELFSLMAGPLLIWPSDSFSSENSSLLELVATCLFTLLTIWKTEKHLWNGTAK